MAEGVTVADVGAVAGSANAEWHDEIANRLRHSHLPRLEATDVIDADSGGTTIAGGHRFDLAISVHRRRRAAFTSPG